MQKYRLYKRQESSEYDRIWIMKDGIKDFPWKSEKLLEPRDNAERVLFGIEFLDINHFAEACHFSMVHYKVIFYTQEHENELYRSFR